MATSNFWTLKGRLLYGRGSNQAEFRTHLSSYNMLSLPESIKRIRSKTAEKNWQHRFSHYKSMEIFSDAKGQLTPQSVVESRRTSNSSGLSSMPLLPACLKRIG